MNAGVAFGKWRRHSDEALGLINPEGEPSYAPPSPFNGPRLSFQGLSRRRSIARVQVPNVVATEPVLSEAEVVTICREHFAQLGGLVAAAAHYGLSQGRLSQIQTGIYVSCPRVQSALGIHHKSGVYRRIA